MMNAAAFWLQPVVMNFEVFPYPTWKYAFILRQLYLSRWIIIITKCLIQSTRTRLIPMAGGWLVTLGGLYRPQYPLLEMGNATHLLMSLLVLESIRGQYDVAFSRVPRWPGVCQWVCLLYHTLPGLLFNPDVEYYCNTVDQWLFHPILLG